MTDHSGLLAEHDLSFYLESENKRVILDGGQADISSCKRLQMDSIKKYKLAKAENIAAYFNEMNIEVSSVCHCTGIAIYVI